MQAINNFIANTTENATRYKYIAGTVLSKTQNY